MMEAAVKLEYERAAQLRDKIKRLERMAFGLDKPKPVAPAKPPGSAHSSASDQARGRHEGHKVVGVSSEKQLPGRTRGRCGADGTAVGSTAAGAATGAAAGSTSQKQGRLKLVPDRPE